jgi:sec-independent protein translocase protein TatB
VDFFGIGPLELMLILVLALVVFGPGKLPEIGAKLGGSLREMRKATREFSREIDETRQAIEGPINDMKEPMQELAAPFQDAGTAVAGARDVLSNPSKAIEGYVMGQYASADKPAKTAADVPPPAHPAESADALAGETVAADSTAAETELVAPDGMSTDAAAVEAVAETDAVAADAVAADAVAADAVAADAIATEPSISEPAAEAGVAAAEAEPVEPIGSETTSGAIAVSPDPGVVSAIAAMENAFANATPSSSENVAWAGETAMAHKMPEVADGPVVAADSEIAAPESPATTSPESIATAAASDAPAAYDAPSALPDAAVAVPEPPQVLAPSTTVEPAGQAAAELPPAQPVATRARHRAAPRKSASPNPQPPAGEGEAPSSDTPASQD